MVVSLGPYFDVSVIVWASFRAVQRCPRWKNPGLRIGGGKRGLCWCGWFRGSGG